MTLRRYDTCGRPQQVCRCWDGACYKGSQITTQSCLRLTVSKTAEDSRFVSMEHL